MVTYKEFKIDDLFDTHVVSKKLTKAALSPDGIVPVYSSDTRNNGILGYTEEESIFIVDETQPTYILFGDHTRTVNIAHESFCVMDNVKVLSPKLNLSDEALLYIKTVWIKGIPVFGYARHWGVAKDVVLSLPVKPGTDDINYSEDDIDWDYMEQYIRDIQVDKLSTLDTYLQETGLNDTRLTTEEQNILSAKPTLGEFKVEDLFDTHVVSNKLTKAAFSPNGFIPAYSSDTRNNGILGYTEQEPTFIVDETQPTYVIFGDHTRTINIVHDSFCVMDNVKVLSPKLNLSDEILLYIKTVWTKSIPVLGYARHWGVAKDVTLSLPIRIDEYSDLLLDDDGNCVPDWDYMEAYIRAIEKKVIADTVTYKDTFIAKAKEIVN